jgi:hypothetical protein
LFVTFAVLLFAGTEVQYYGNIAPNGNGMRKILLTFTVLATSLSAAQAGGTIIILDFTKNKLAIAADRGQPALYFLHGNS